MNRLDLALFVVLSAAPSSSGGFVVRDRAIPTFHAYGATPGRKYQVLLSKYALFYALNYAPSMHGPPDPLQAILRRFQGLSRMFGPFAPGLFSGLFIHPGVQPFEFPKIHNLQE